MTDTYPLLELTAFNARVGLLLNSDLPTPLPPSHRDALLAYAGAFAAFEADDDARDSVLDAFEGLAEVPFLSEHVGEAVVAFASIFED